MLYPLSYEGRALASVQVNGCISVVCGGLGPPV
jgi:hypothetical protein